MFNNIGSHGYAIIHSVQIYNVVYVNVYMYVYTIYINIKLYLTLTSYSTHKRTICSFTLKTNKIKKIKFSIFFHL